MPEPDGSGINVSYHMLLVVVVIIIGLYMMYQSECARAQKYRDLLVKADINPDKDVKSKK
jgi:hypothetical protein